MVKKLVFGRFFIVRVFWFSLSVYLPTKLPPTLHCLRADSVTKYCNSNLNIFVSVVIACEPWCHHDNKWLCIMHLLTVLSRWYGRPDSMCLQPERLTGQTGQYAAATGKALEYSSVYRMASSGKMYKEQMSPKSNEM